MQTTQTKLFRIIKYPTITKTESKKRRKALDYAIANDTDYAPDSIENCERCGVDFESLDNGLRYSDSDLAVVCNYCTWSRKDRLTL